MIKEFVVAAVLILGIPVGYWIAWLCRDELIEGRKWFRSIIAISVLLAIFFFSIRNYIIVSTMIFILIVSFVSLMKSFDKSWTGKKIN